MSLAPVPAGSRMAHSRPVAPQPHQARPATRQLREDAWSRFDVSASPSPSPTHQTSLDGACRGRLSYYADRFNMTFVHVPKAGGSTVEAALGVHGSCHATAETFRALDPKGWLGRTTFAVVRDPLDRLVSLFEYGRHGGNGTPHAAKRFGWLAEMTFGQFVDALTRGKGVDPSSTDWWYGSQTSFVGPCTQDKCAVDVLLRLDNLTNGWATLRHSLPALAAAAARGGA